MAEFDTWADFYDLIHKGLPGEAEFYVGQAVRIGGATLEIGCGTGRIAIPMAMSGVDVTGLDNSKAMLDICRAKKRAIGKTDGKLKLVEKDMADFDLGMEFDFIAMAYRTFMHLLTVQEQRTCLECVRKHLKEDGVFILNLWAARPSDIAQNAGSQQSGFHLAGRHPIPDTECDLVHYCSSHFDEHCQRITEEHLLHEVDERGTVLSTSTLPLVRAWATPREMEHLLRAAGFEVEALFGDFDCHPLSSTSTEMIWIVKKGASSQEA
jgi:SAM-dependent methyltransferase